MKFRDSTETTSFCTVDSMMIECDYLDETATEATPRVNVFRCRPEPVFPFEIREECAYPSLRDLQGTPKLTTLIRLQYDLLYRGISSEERIHLIGTLQRELNVKPERSEYFAPLGVARRERVVLTQPFGLKHRKIQLGVNGNRMDSICELWDDNPIETAVINCDGVPPATILQSHRIGRLKELTLSGITRDGLAKVFTLLNSLGPMNCVTLHLPSSSDWIPASMINRLQASGWKHLKTLDNKRGT